MAHCPPEPHLQGTSQDSGAAAFPAFPNFPYKSPTENLNHETAMVKRERIFKGKFYRKRFFFLNLKAYL